MGRNVLFFIVQESLNLVLLDWTTGQMALHNNVHVGNYHDATIMIQSG